MNIHFKKATGFLSILFLLMIAIGCEEGSTENNEYSCKAEDNRTGYPSGPYGTIKNTILEKVVLTDSDGNEFSFESIYQNGSKRLLLISTAAGWCSVCRTEQPLLNKWHEEYSEKGLSVVVALFEDNSFEPATNEFTQQWINNYDLNFQVLVDSENYFAKYYDTSSAPMNMLVDVCTMEILDIFIGGNADKIESYIGVRL